MKNDHKHNNNDNNEDAMGIGIDQLESEDMVNVDGSLQPKLPNLNNQR